jgi:hypothetical protein
VRLINWEASRDPRNPLNFAGRDIVHTSTLSENARAHCVAEGTIVSVSKYKKVAEPSWQAGFRAGSAGNWYVLPANVHHALYRHGYIIGRRLHARLQERQRPPKYVALAKEFNIPPHESE